MGQVMPLSTLPHDGSFHPAGRRGHFRTPASVLINSRKCDKAEGDAPVMPCHEKAVAMSQNRVYRTPVARAAL
jgi:hypothetical protein